MKYMDIKKVYYSIVNKSDIKIDKKLNNLETEQSKFILNNMMSYLKLNIPEINISQGGKPYFKDSNIYFNYSHSKNYIACAIGNCEVGIDIEETSRIINDDIAKKYLDNAKGNLKRIETWIKKEAYSKLKGLGLQINFQNIKLDNLKEKNLLINKKEYLCSIYSEDNDIEFEEIMIK